jgi:hypothetical protein
MRKIIMLVAFLAVALVGIASAAYVTKIYFASDRAGLVVASSGYITVEDGGDVNVESGGEIDIASGGALDHNSGGTLNLHGVSISAAQAGYLGKITAGIGTIDSASAVLDTLGQFEPNTVFLVNPLASSCVTTSYYMLAADSSFVVAFWDSIGVGVRVEEYSYIAITP